MSSVLNNFLDRDDDDDDDDDLVNKKKPIKEETINKATEAHDRIYNQGATSEASSRDLGSAAALQAFKMFSGGGSKGGSSNELIGLAMGEAMKLYNSKGGSSGGADQSEMLKSAAAMAFKLYQSKGSGGGSGGGQAEMVTNLLGSFLGGAGGESEEKKKPSGAAALLSKFL